ncbi:MAG: hypothetical protein WBZ48_04755 [Bacteroidota bacterium]
MKITSSMFLIVILAAAAAAQELKSSQSADTLVPKSLVFSSPKNSLGNLSFLPPLRLADLAVTREFPVSSFGYALLSEPPVPGERADFSWEMSFRPKKDDPIEVLRMMLGAVEAGGAAYIAYRHISKYGFLK